MRFCLTLAISCVLLVSAAAQDADPGVCTSAFGCHKKHPSERVDCPKCGKRKIPANDAACTICAIRAKICMHCGNPRPVNGRNGRKRVRFPTVLKVRREIHQMRAAKLPSTSIGRPTKGRLENAAEMPLKGPGYRVVRPGRKTHFGTDEMVFGLMELGARMYDLYGKDADFIIGDIGSEKGGKLKPHITHQHGRDVDIGLYLCDEKGRPRGNRMTTCGKDGMAKNGVQFDVARNWEFVTAMIENGQFVEIRAILLADWLKALLLDHARKLQARCRNPVEARRLKDLIKKAGKYIRQPSSSPHANHYHLSLKCTKEDRKAGGR